LVGIGLRYHELKGDLHRIVDKQGNNIPPGAAGAGRN
jgi:hypothetical protein